MFCKFLKLFNGDNIIVMTDCDCSDFKNLSHIDVIDPVLISTVKFAQGPYIVESYTMQQWIKVAKKDIIKIPTKSVIVAVDVHESVVEQYNQFVIDSEKDEAISFDSEAMDQLDDSYDDYYDEDDIEEDEQTEKRRYRSTIH